LTAVDLELSDEQTWLSESVETLLARDPEHRRVWPSLVEFGALSVDRDGGLGAVELCLISRALGEHLASVPYLGSAAVRFAAEPLAPDLGEHAVALAVLEPGSGWATGSLRTSVGLAAGGAVVEGRKVAVEHAAAPAGRLAAVAAGPDGPVVAVVEADAHGVDVTMQAAFDPSIPVSAVDLAGVRLAAEPLGGDTVPRLMAIASLLAAADAVGAAGRLLQDACAYAGERRQFGRTIGSFQALRHLLADMYVRQASSWSSVLYAAAALDEDAAGAARTASIAKAYVSRASREVAHGALQVFGGIAITAEHPAHRFLRRIVVRGQQFGDAAHHERMLGRALASAAVPKPVRA
jgi:alkylation response protein AidB-like acyl-CoA dehydrogenase